MHELSLAQNIVEIVQRYVPATQNELVRSVKLKVGDLSGVVPDSLDFCFSAIVAETSLRGARLEIEHIPYTLHCRRCDHTFASEFGVVICPHCNETSTEVIAGTEMQVVEIELLDNGAGECTLETG